MLPGQFHQLLVIDIDSRQHHTRWNVMGCQILPEFGGRDLSQVFLRAYVRETKSIVLVGCLMEQLNKKWFCVWSSLYLLQFKRYGLAFCCYL